MFFFHALHVTYARVQTASVDPTNVNALKIV